MMDHQRLQNPALLILGAFLLLGSPEGAAQPSLATEPWRWTRFGLQEGLRSETVLNIVENASGETWALTPAGPQWFDGFSWKRPDLGALPVDNFLGSTLSADAHGVLLCASGKVYRVEMASVTPLPVIVEGDTVPVSRAVPVNGGRILLQSDSTLLLWEAGSVRLLPSAFDISYRFAEFGFGISQTSSHDAWLNAYSGLYRWSGRGWNLAEPASGRPFQLQSLDEGKNGTVVAAIRPWVFYKVRDLSPPGHSPRYPEIDFGRTTAVAVGPAGEALIHFFSGNVAWGEAGKWDLLPLPDFLRSLNSLKFRKNGDLWVATSDGLYLWRRNLNRWKTLLLPGGNDANTITEILRGADGGYWIGNSAGLAALTSRLKVRPIPEIPAPGRGGILSLGQDAKGRIWAGSSDWFQGAYRFDGNSWKRFGFREGMPIATIHRMARDRKGRLWFLGISTSMPGLASEREPGAYILDGDALRPFEENDKLLDRRVYAFAEASDGSYWFGSFDGVSRRRNGRWSYWTTGNGLRTGKIFALLPLPDGRVLFAHQNYGIGLIDTTGRVRYYTTRDGLPSDEAWSFALDSTGAAWAGTRFGIARFDGEMWSHENLNSGLRIPITWPLHFDRNALFIGTSGGGVSVLDLTSLAGPAVDFQIEPLREMPGDRVLEWNARTFWNEIPPSSLPCRYRLNGGEWSGWTREHKISVRDLPGGQHEIQLQAKGYLGVAGTSAPIPFEIPRPFFARPEFYVPFLFLAALLIVVSVISIRRVRLDRRMIRERDARYRAVVETQTEPVWRMTPGGRLTFANGAFCRFFGVVQERAIGSEISEYFQGLPWERMLAAMQRADGEVFSHDAEVVRPEASRSWFHLLFAAIHDPDGVFVEIQGVGEDITKRKAAEEGLTSSLREKEVLLKEIHHRVKNNLQVISSLLNLQAQTLEDASLRGHFVESQNRVRSMALIHERLYQSHSLADISFEAYARDLVVQLQRSYSPVGVTVSVLPTPILLGIDLAVPLGLIMNELVTNGLKHAFPDKRRGTITIALASDGDGRLELKVADDGVGIPQEMDLTRTKTLGMQLIDVLASQIEARVEIRREKGTMFVLSFPLDKERTA